MPLLHRLASLWRTLFRRARLDCDLDDELDSALQLLTARHQARGLSPDAARRAARLEMGGVQQVREATRDARIGSSLESLALDVRYAWRSLYKARGFTVIVVATLALGIGAATAIFSVVHALLLAPLPYRNADRLVVVWSDMTAAGYPRAPLSGPELDDLRQHSTACSAFGAIWSNTATLTGDGDPEQLRIGRVTDNFFSVLGADAAYGRTFREEDGRAGAQPAILLSWAVFSHRYGGDPSIVGRMIRVNDRPTQVVGVMPSGFRLLLPADSSVPDDLQAWLPFPAAMVHGPRGQQFLRVVGRMRAGVAVDQARADVDAVAAGISRKFADYGTSGRQFTTVALQTDDVREVRPVLIGLFSGVMLLLVIAGVNVANLLIARAAARRAETAMRRALGASRWRLVRQCLAEGLLLAIFGGAAAVAVGWSIQRLLIVIRPASLSRIDLASIHLPVVLFTVVMALVCAALLSLAPLVEVVGRDVTDGWRGAHRTTTPGLQERMRRILVMMQVAVSVILLVCTVLLARGFRNVLAVDPGFRAAGVLTFRLAVPMQRYRPPDGFNAFTTRLRERLAAVPGVVRVGAISHIPYDDLPNWGTPYLADAAINDPAAPNADARTVAAGTLDTLGVPLVEGRYFTSADEASRARVIIVDDKLAARMWPGRSAIGQHLGVDPGSTGRPTVNMSVVGVVRHVRLRSLVDDLTEQIFFPQATVMRNPLAFVVRTAGDPEAVAVDIRHAVAAVDPAVPVYDVRPLLRYEEGARATRRFTMQLALAFAVAALLLASIGVYGIMAYAMTTRRHELGIRLALGALPTRIVADAVREGLTLAAVGAVIGLIAAAPAARWLRHELYLVRPIDPVSFGLTIAVLTSSCALATWLPARRARRLNPVDVLRTD